MLSRTVSISLLMAFHMPVEGQTSIQSNGAKVGQSTPGSGGQAVTAQPLPAWKDTLVQSDVSLLPSASQENWAGYFPTEDDLEYLGDRDYPRSSSINEIAPDARAQNSMGLYGYKSGPSDFFNRHPNAFRGINRTLGLFTEHQAGTIEFGQAPELSLSVDATSLSSIFTRKFEPSKAHLKAGPLAFDVLWIGAGIVWSDYEAPVNPFPPGRGDGVVGYLDLALRGQLRLTDSLYFSWATNLVYLPGESKLTFQTLSGYWPQLAVDLFYQKRINQWDVSLANQFYARPGLDIFADIDRGGMDQAGRYYFGYYGRDNQTGFYDNDIVYFVNSTEVQASRMFFDTNWRFWATYQHMDFWRTFNFEDYVMRDTWEFALNYEGNAIPFAPRFVYLLNVLDGYDTFFHQFQAQFSGRVTENIGLHFMAGYLWTSSVRPSQDSLVWSITLDHNFSRYGSHGFNVGQQFITDSYSPEARLATYYQYFLRHQIGRRLFASAYAQYSQGDTIVNANSNNSAYNRGDLDSYLVGLSLEYSLFDMTRVAYNCAFERSDGDLNARRTDRWLHRLQIQHQLSTRLTLQAGYQYETFNADSGFTEHSLNMSIRRFF